jgi:hypothetical protein
MQCQYCKCTDERACVGGCCWIAEGVCSSPTCRRQHYLAELAEEPEPIHAWFSLSYANYLIEPRSILQSAPVEWQRQFIALLLDLHEMFDRASAPASYRIVPLNVSGEETRDKFKDYDRGRRRIPRKDVQ